MRVFQTSDDQFSPFLNEYSIDSPISGSDDFRAERVEKGSEVKDPWNRVGPILRGMLNGPVFERWFAEARLVQEEDGAWVLLVPSYTHCLWIETNFLPELQTALAEVFEGADAHSVQIREEEALSLEGEGDGAASDSKPKKPALDGELFENFNRSQDEPAEFAKRLKTARLNPDYAFERFVVGSSNEFAHACCVAISKGLGQTYNPLFLHGDAGMGKTHLVQALGQAVMRNRPRSKVVYLTCERFTNEFIDAVQKGNLKRFRSNYRKADVFIVDDVQFLNGKEKTGDEFFHTFNALLDMKAQIILTSDRPACEIQTLEPRLVSRFESGLTVAMQPPSLEMRTAILQKKVAEWHADIPHEVLSYIAEHVKSNVRRLEGALVRVATFSSLGRGKLSLSRVEELLKDILREEASRKVTIDSVQRMVADYYDLRISDMTGRRRPKAIAHARQVAMFLSRELTKNSLKEIGEAFGGRDHGTIIHAVNKVRALVENDEEIRQTIDLLSSKLSR